MQEPAELQRLNGIFPGIMAPNEGGGRGQEKGSALIEG